MKSKKNGKIKINRCSSGTNQLSDYLKHIRETNIITIKVTKINLYHIPK